MMVPRTVLLLCALLALPTVVVAGESRWVWWEGEDVSATNFPDETWLSASTFPERRDGLSNGDWLTNAGSRESYVPFARWAIEVPRAGIYDLWCRKFWKHGPFRWRFGDDDWHTCGRDIALADTFEIRTHLCANWVHLGELALKPGATTFHIELLIEVGQPCTAAFDCFCLTLDPFLPRGALKPGEVSRDADEGFFAWVSEPDAFTKEAKLDLRHLNEAHAGVHGRVRVHEDGFRLGDGTPVRFWGVNAGPGVVELDPTSVRYLARRLAKRGVNAVRFHGPIYDPRSPNRGGVDEGRLEAIQRFVAAMKAEGIYTKLSIYFPLWFKIEGKPAFSLIYFDRELQRIHRAWWKRLLTAPNPYGEPLGKDPAVFLVEAVNEDSFFFWTFKPDELQTGRREMLEKRFAAWARKRYQTVPKALEAWGHREKGDSVEQRRLVLYPAGDLGRGRLGSRHARPPGPPGPKPLRLRDQARFLAEVQRGFYNHFGHFLFEECGYEGPYSASNWQTADPTLTDAIERYTYLAGHVIDQHGYFGGSHEGPGARYSVRKGHDFSNRAAVRHPTLLPIQAAQVERYPHFISEIGWTNPNLYRADFAPIAAAYGALQGIDGFCAFAMGGAGDDQTMEKFAASCPVILGNFPLWALAYRRGDIAEGGPAVITHDRYDRLFDLERDPPRRHGERQGPWGPPAWHDRLAFYVGRVARRYGLTVPPRNPDLEPYIDRDGGVVTSLTKELVWRWKEGLITIDTPRTKGATGFLSQRRIELGRFAFEVQNEYGSIGITALDGSNLLGARRLLIQTMTVERPRGFRTSDQEDGSIFDLGRAPFGVERIRAVVRIPGSRRPNALALDENGYPKSSEVEIQREPEGWRIRLPEDTVYVVVER